MKKFVKKSAASTLSAIGILSAMPPAFCVPPKFYSEIKNVRTSNRIYDIFGLSRECEIYEYVIDQYGFEHDEIYSRNCYIVLPYTVDYPGAVQEEYLAPKGALETVIYLPKSFSVDSFFEILKQNGIIDEDGNCLWEYEVRRYLHDKNNKGIFFMSGNVKIVFLFDSSNLNYYDDILKSEKIKINKLFKKVIYTKGLRGVEILSPTSKIKEGAFKNREGLDYIYISRFAKNIEESTFEGCKDLEYITIPNSIKSIGKSAFKGCKKLKEVYIPEGVTTVEDDTFNGCVDLADARMSCSVKSIGKRAFKDCKSLTRVIITGNVTSIGDDIFSGCENLEEVNIFGILTSIGDRAFAGCKKLRQIRIPSFIRDLGENVFEGCENLNHIEFMNKVYDNPESFNKAFKAHVANHQ